MHLHKSNEIFISYSWANSKKVHSVAELLRTIGFTVWLDTTHLDLNRDIKSQIYYGIINSDYFLLIDSEFARLSSWVQWETAIALRHINQSNILRYSINENCIFTNSENLRKFKLRYGNNKQISVFKEFSWGNIKTAYV